MRKGQAHGPDVRWQDSVYLEIDPSQVALGPLTKPTGRWRAEVQEEMRLARTKPSMIWLVIRDADVITDG